uniref:Uncharacterized protein n=1 Tax=Manihot esculenta TaxID=3983 RepID=A0A2C9VZZ8_MANES
MNGLKSAIRKSTKDNDDALREKLQSFMKIMMGVTLRKEIRQSTKDNDALREELRAFMDIMMSDKCKEICSSEEGMLKTENRGKKDGKSESRELLPIPREFFTPIQGIKIVLETLGILLVLLKLPKNELVIFGGKEPHDVNSANDENVQGFEHEIIPEASLVNSRYQEVELGNIPKKNRGRG